MLVSLCSPLADLPVVSERSAGSRTRALRRASFAFADGRGSVNFGQVHECTVEIGNFANDAKALEKVKDAFHRRHEELYTFPSRITRWKSSTSKARSTDTSTNRNRRA